MEMKSGSVRFLFVHFYFSDNVDRINVFLSGRTFAATAAPRKAVFELVRIHFSCQRIGINPCEQPEKTIADAILERIRRAVPVKNTDR